MRDPHVASLFYRLETGPQLALPLDGAMRLDAFPSCCRIVLTVALLLLTAPAWAGDASDDRATLKGITEVDVVVERLEPDAERDGLTKSQLQTDVELRLRQSGIKVIRSSMGYLYVGVQSMKLEDRSSHVYAIEVSFHQVVRLDRDPTILHYGAPTWGVGGIGIVGTDRVRELRSDVIDYVDRFINAYLEQNPKR